MNNSRLTQLLQQTGRLIMENGGEIYRVQETLRRMGKAIGLEKVDCFAVPSGLFFSWQRDDGTSETCLTRVRHIGSCLWRVDAANSISRALEAGEMTSAQALDRINTLSTERPPYSPGWVLLGSSVCAAAFTLMFGGGWPEAVLIAIIAPIAQLACMLLERRGQVPFGSVLLGSFISALLPGLLALYLPLKTDMMIAGAVMPFVPGLSMTKAVADLIRGDMVSGISSGFSAILTAGMIALGTLLSSGILTLLAGGGL